MRADRKTINKSTVCMSLFISIHKGLVPETPLKWHTPHYFYLQKAEFVDVKLANMQVWLQFSSKKILSLF